MSTMSAGSSSCVLPPPLRSIVVLLVVMITIDAIPSTEAFGFGVGAPGTTAAARSQWQHHHQHQRQKQQPLRRQGRGQERRTLPWLVVLGSTTEESPASSSSSSSSSSTLESKASDFATAMPSESSIYEKLGWEEEQVALGIKPEDILEYLGTREDLIAKFMRDNKSFTRERAEDEVDRFIRDPENVDAFIEYEKRKRANPQSLREEAESNLSDPSTWATYGIWIVGGAGFASLKNLYFEPKFASGEWSDITIHLPQPDWFAHSPPVDAAVSAVGDAVGHSVVEPAAIQNVLEGVSGAVNDALTKCVGEACS